MITWLPKERAPGYKNFAAHSHSQHYHDTVDDHFCLSHALTCFCPKLSHGRVVRCFSHSGNSFEFKDFIRTSDLIGLRKESSMNLIGMGENDLAKEFFGSVEVDRGQVSGPQVPLLGHGDDKETPNWASWD